MNIKQYCREFADFYKFNGEIFISKENDILCHEVFGWSDIIQKIPLEKNMLFAVGSITKQFIAASVLNLQQKELIDINRPIGSYLSFLPEPSKNISIKYLLYHSSGLESLPNSEGSKIEIEGYISKDDFLKYFVDKELRFKTGSKFEYSNSAYYLLGILIEEVSNLSLSNYLINNIFKKAGMINTYFPANGTVAEIRKKIKNNILVKGLTYNESLELIKVEDNLIDLNTVFSAGSMISTVEDLLKWNYYLYDGNFINKINLKYMLKPKIDNSCDGLFLKILPNKSKMYIHSGGMEGFHSCLAYIPKEKVTVIFLSNNQKQCFGNAFNDLPLLACGNEYAKERKRKAINEDIRSFQGEYSGKYYDDEINIRIISSFNKLKLLFNKKCFSLKKINKDMYYPEGMRPIIHFKRDRDNNIRQLNFWDDSYMKIISLIKKQ